MLRVITSRQFTTRQAFLNTAIKPVSLRYSSTTTPTKNSTENHSSKIYALPFKLPEEKVGQIVNFASYVNQHAILSIFKIIKSVGNG